MIRDENATPSEPPADDSIDDAADAYFAAWCAATTQQRHTVTAEDADRVLAQESSR